MPKKIENIRESILQDAHAILKTEGYEALTIRRVAKDCAIAVGTVYNYFPSKEVLSASIMLEDWQKTLKQINQKCQKTNDLAQGIRWTYQGVMSFARTYRSAWSSYIFTGHETQEIKHRHAQLVQQIASCLHPFLNGRQPRHYDLYLAENILTCVSGSSVEIQDFITIVTNQEKKAGGNV
jgi:Transcriptional regulator